MGFLDGVLEDEDPFPFVVHPDFSRERLFEATYEVAPVLIEDVALAREAALAKERRRRRQVSYHRTRRFGVSDPHGMEDFVIWGYVPDFSGELVWQGDSYGADGFLTRVDEAGRPHYVTDDGSPARPLLAVKRDGKLGYAVNRGGQPLVPAFHKLMPEALMGLDAEAVERVLAKQVGHGPWDHPDMRLTEKEREALLDPSCGYVAIPISARRLVTSTGWLYGAVFTLGCRCQTGAPYLHSDRLDELGYCLGTMHKGQREKWDELKQFAIVVTDGECEAARSPIEAYEDARASNFRDDSLPIQREASRDRDALRGRIRETPILGQEPRGERESVFTPGP